MIAVRLKGMGVGAVYIPAFLDALRFCLVKLHYPDDVGTYGLLSGLLTASLCLGSSIGSAAGRKNKLLTFYNKREDNLRKNTYVHEHTIEFSGFFSPH